MARRPSLEASYYNAQQQRAPSPNRGSVSASAERRGSIISSSRRGSLSSASSLGSGSAASDGTGRRRSLSPSGEEKQQLDGVQHQQQQQASKASYEETNKVLKKRLVALSSEAHEKYRQLEDVEAKARRIQALLAKHDELLAK